jgi:hypothetical protein
MGLDYSYVLLIKQSDERLLLEHIAQTGSIHELREPFGTCVTLDFALDNVLTDYLKISIRDFHGDSWTKWRPLDKSKHRNFFPTDTTGRVGCIYLEIKPSPPSEYAYVSFVAATSSMSRLLQDSPSIREWFIQLSRLTNASAAFIDLEEQGFEFIYWQGNSVSATLNEELEVIQNADLNSHLLVNVCQGYANLFLT